MRAFCFDENKVMTWLSPVSIMDAVLFHGRNNRWEREVVGILA
jgi:hypothetical protein